MDAKDLMIGDLVRVAKDVCIPKGSIVQVRGIDADNKFPERGLKGCATCVRLNDPDRMSGGVWAEFLEPIPLTPEILEKNGIKYQWGMPWYQGGYDGIGYEVHFDLHCQIPISYVHELQHALRLCRINKNIEL